MKSIPFPDHESVAGVDQGYAPLHFRRDVIKVKSRKGEYDQTRFRYAFKPTLEEIADLIAGRAIYLDLWQDIIPPMRMHVFDTAETLPTRISSSIHEGEAFLAYEKRKDEGWKPYVYLDGVEVKNCDIADTIAGEVRVMRIDDDRPAVDEFGDIATDILKGQVSIIWRMS